MNSAALDYEHLAQVVRDFRTRAGLSQQEVAARGGPSDTTLSQIESAAWRSARPGPTLRKLDEGLGWAPGAASHVAFDLLPLDQVPLAGQPHGPAAPDPLSAARLAAFKSADPASLSDEQLAQQIEALGSYTVHLEEVMDLHEQEVARLRARLDDVAPVLLKAEDEQIFRRATEDVPEDPGLVIRPAEFISLVAGSLLARDISLPNHYTQPDLVVITPDGRTIVVEIQRVGTAESLSRDADDLRRSLVRAARGDSGRRVFGVVVDARDHEQASVLDVIDQMIDAKSPLAKVPPALDRPTVEAWLDDKLPDAARDIGKPSRGQEKRATADQAGEPPADDPDDMEPR